MQPLQICIGPTIRIGRESWCLPYTGFFHQWFDVTCVVFQLSPLLQIECAGHCWTLLDTAGHCCNVLYITFRFSTRGVLLRTLHCTRYFHLVLALHITSYLLLCLALQCTTDLLLGKAIRSTIYLL